MVIASVLNPNDALAHSS